MWTVCVEHSTSIIDFIEREIDCQDYYIIFILCDDCVISDCEVRRDRSMTGVGATF